MNKQKVSNWLGLAFRAGSAVTGDQACMAEIRKGRAQLVLLAQDAGPNTKKKYQDKCAYYRVPLIEVLNKEELGRALGKHDRAAVVITNHGFAKNILLELGEQIGGEVIE
jgi:ribosomal protein L7Ae-like RNA K-turn-binding protein